MKAIPLLLAFIAASCSTFPRTAQTVTIKNQISQAESLAGRGDARGAIEVYERTINVAGANPWQDRVLYELGRLYAESGNPGRDLGRSQYYFQRLKTEFPGSRYALDTAVWLGILEKITALEFELKAVQAEYDRDVAALELETARLRAEIQARTAEADQRALKIKELEALVSSQKTVIETLQRQIRKMKEIDIRSEKKAQGIK